MPFTVPSVVRHVILRRKQKLVKGKKIITLITRVCLREGCGGKSHHNFRQLVFTVLSCYQFLKFVNFIDFFFWLLPYFI